MSKPKPTTCKPSAINNHSISRRSFVQSGTALGSLAFFPVGGSATERGQSDVARGIVFEDRDGTGRPSEQNVGIPNVAVSNGQAVAVTDQNGRWELPIDDQVDCLFVIKPRGWMVRLDQDNLPQTTYLHSPNGSPQLRFGGIPTTGPLPESINFGLVKQEEPDQFRVLFCGDPQPRDLREVDYIARSAVPQLRQSDAAFSINLGDIMFDDLSLYPFLNQAMALVNKPMFNVLGNHDLNFDADDNRHAYDTFKRTYGASYYAFDWGPVHFLVLNNVEWTGADPQSGRARGSYRGFLGQRQLEFIKNDLALVPQDKLIVLAMHIPLVNGVNASPGVETVDREQLFELLADRPHLLSFSAHMHWHANLFLNDQHGWTGEQPLHHIVAGTLCGSWFTGAPNADGIPHAMMGDGNPRGYVEVEFNGNQYSIDGYRSIGLPNDFQIQITCPIEVKQSDLAETSVYANVFEGSEESNVKMRIGSQNQWTEMERVLEENPAHRVLFLRDNELERPYRPLSRATICQHLWHTKLSADIQPGTYLVEVESIDRYGNRQNGITTLRVT